MKNQPCEENLGRVSLYRPSFKSHCLIVEYAGATNNEMWLDKIENTLERARKPHELERKHFMEIKIWGIVYW